MVYSQGGMLVPLLTQNGGQEPGSVIVTVETKEHALIMLKHS